jgi:formylglycine-generating enzyme required for sulfatase activity
MSETTRQLTVEERSENAAWMIDRFEQRFDLAHRKLAQYAALALVLTPELVSYLRDRFLRKVLPWVAEADVLLSDLCRPVGYEQYAMEPAVRSQLIQELEAEHPEQVELIAQILLSYIQRLRETRHSFFSPLEQRNQQWSAMCFIAAHRGAVAEQVKAAFESVIEGIEGEEPQAAISGRSVLEQLVMIMEELAPRLVEYPELIRQAEQVTIALEDARSNNTRSLTQLIRGEAKSENKMGTTDHAPEIADYPALETFDIETVTIDETVTDEASIYSQFEFQVATIEVRESEPGLVRRVLRRSNKPEIVIHKRSASAWQVVEPLGEGLDLEMVVIPGGKFLMGSPEDELDSYSDEQPQHEVIVPEFWMGKYPITQWQWHFVAGLPQVNRKIDRDPANFKEDRRPIEQVSWWDAVEFCDRLSKLTGRIYRLPSEAEWEYACRAGTTDPFHFGETIDALVANYAARKIYGKGRAGEYREQTNIVDSFEVANAFGLFDMHGNVWEWCADHWHDNYEGAPINGSAWLTDNENASRVRRGGSWIYHPRRSRSAARAPVSPVNRDNHVGFRIMSSPQDSSS